MISVGGSFMAKGSAAPRKGPVQEIAIKKAKIPPKKLPPYPPLEVALLAASIPGKVISNTPNSDSANTKTIAINAT